MLSRTALRVIVAVYAVAVVVHLLPESPIRRGLRGFSQAVINPLFVQRWNLFSPDPPTANLSTLLVVRYRTPGGTEETVPVDAGAAMRKDARTHHVFPPRTIRVLSDINRTLERRMYEDVREALEGRIDVDHPPPAFTQRVLRRRARAQEPLRRELSAWVRGSHAPVGWTPVEVRGLVVRTAIVPFDRRRTVPRVVPIQPPTGDELPALLQPDVVESIRGRWTSDMELVYDSGWMPIASDVEPLEVAW